MEEFNINKAVFRSVTISFKKKLYETQNSTECSIKHPHHSLDIIAS